MNAVDAAIHMSIFHTMAVYHTAIDNADFAAMANAFADDGVIEVSGNVFVGREAIIAGMSLRTRQRMTGAAGVFQRHNLTTRRIDLLGPESASCVSYFMVLSELGLDHFGRYFDSFVPVEDRWLISRRRSQLDWMHEQSRFRVNSHPT